MTKSRPRHPLHHPLSRAAGLACAAGLALAVAPPARATVYTWTGGVYVPDFTFPQTLVGGDVLNITGADLKDFWRWNFESRGTVNWSGGTVNVGGLYFGNAVVTQVWNRGLWSATGNDTLFTYGPVTFLNTATLRKDSSNGDTTVTGSGSFVNTGGVIDARSGRIVFFGASHDRILFNDDSKFIGAGQTVVSEGATFSGRQTSDNLVLQGGRLIGNGATLQGGFAGAGVVRFAGGTFGGTWTLAAGTTLVGAAGTAKAFSCSGCGFTQPAADITNLGTVSWETTEAALFGGSSSVFRNQGRFAFKADSAMNWSGAAGAALFTNSGTISVAAGKSVAINSAGGDFRSNGGTLSAAAGATLTFTGGGGNISRFDNGSRYNGAGQVLLRGSNTFVGTQKSANLNIAGVAIGGDGSAGSKAVLNGKATIGATDVGGNLAGTWQIGTTATLTVVDSIYQSSISGNVLNKGRIVVQSGAGFNIGGGADVLTNHGTIEFQRDSGIGWNGTPGGSPAQVGNHGVITKTAGSGTSWILPPGSFSNAADGTLWVQSGSIGLPAGFVNDGLMKGNGSFATSALFNNGVLAPGNSVGALRLTGHLSQTAAGTLAIELASPTAADALTVDGTLALGGTLRLVCAAACGSALQVGNKFTLVDAAGDMTGTFASVVTEGFGSGFGYTLAYDRTNDRVRLTVTGLAPAAPLPMAAAMAAPMPAAVPEPASGVLMLAGLAAVATIRGRRRASRPAPR